MKTSASYSMLYALQSILNIDMSEFIELSFNSADIDIVTKFDSIKHVKYSQL